MNKLSVVVIIYKVEQYITQCIESILNQTYRDFELVLVDDGSPDSCPDICDEYASRDNRIKVIHQENSGSVSARWNGYLNASGEYILFIDGDDWIEQDMFEKMTTLGYQNNADLVIVGYNEVSEDAKTEKDCPIASGIYSNESIHNIYEKAIYTGEFYQAGINPSLWNKLIRRSLLSCIIPPDPSLKMGDDAAVSYPVISKAGTIVINNEYHLYNYRIVNGSLSRAFDKSYFERAIKLFSGLADNLENNNEMFASLYPYCLFITQIGIWMLFDRDNGLIIKDRKLFLKNYYWEFTDIMTSKSISKDLSVYSDNEKILNLFVKGRINRLIMYIYVQKIFKRLKR